MIIISNHGNNLDTRTKKAGTGTYTLKVHENEMKTKSERNIINKMNILMKILLIKIFNLQLKYQGK